MDTNGDDLEEFVDEAYSNKLLMGANDEDDENEVEPLVGSTLNLFKLSGKNIPTETDKYESSVYQTPELNPQLNESMKGGNQAGSIHNATSNEQVIDAIKKLEYDSSSQ